MDSQPTTEVTVEMKKELKELFEKSDKPELLESFEKMLVRKAVQTS